MVLIKTQKTNAYFKRYQVKYKRRREGKTDYKQRRSLINQDKTKYNSPKKRFVVRITNTKVICQVIIAKIQGDEVLCAADSTELKRYGMPVGLTNYAATYATGLLCARRLLKKYGLDKRYEGVVETDGSDYIVEQPEDDSAPRPFKAFLDVGLSRTTTGSRIFGAMKGACDGGLYIPHKDKRFPGHGKEGDNGEETRRRIYAQHVADFMKSLKEQNEEEYNSRFSKYIKEGIKPEDLEQKIKQVHKAIRADPERKTQKKSKPKVQKRFNKQKMDLGTRKARIESKKQKMLANLQAMEEEEEEE